MADIRSLTLSSRAHDLSIPLRFNDAQPNAYHVPPASASACEAGDLVGDTRRGGSCNFEQYTLIPHCNGTHTECIGHITHERITVVDCLKDILIRAFVVSVQPEHPADSGEIYAADFEPSDQWITMRSLQDIEGPAGDATALVIRTLPNDESKLSRSYSGDPMAPYFTTEAMEFIVQCGFEHLLVDLPSIDRLFDGGKLSNHRIFWNVEPGSFELNPHSRTSSTVTEMIYLPNEIRDGEYGLNLQIAPFATDAAPSRPILLPLDALT